MKDNILKRLKTECPFPQVFEDLERSEDGFTNVPRRKIGHLRADYNGRRWWNTAWPCHPALATAEIKAEIDQQLLTLIPGKSRKKTESNGNGP